MYPFILLVPLLLKNLKLIRQLYFFYFFYCASFCNAQVLDSASLKKVDSLISVAEQLADDHKFEQAQQTLSNAETLCIEKLGMRSIAYARVNMNQGRGRYLSGEYEAADSLLNKALALYKQIVGTGHIEYANCLFQLASVNNETGNLAAADSLAQSAETIIAKSDPHSLVHALLLVLIGSINNHKGEYYKAEQNYLESRSLFETYIGKENRNYAFILLNSFSDLYRDLGDYEKAELLNKESAEILLRLQGPEGADYMTNRFSLGGLYYELGNYKKATELYLQTIAVWEKTLGKEHPNYATAIGNLALVYQDKGEFSKAESLYIESNAIREKVFGKTHFDYANGLDNLAGLYFEMQDYQKTESLMLESKSIYEKSIGKNHPDYATNIHNLAEFYMKTGQLKKSESYYLEAQSILEKTLGKEHMYTIYNNGYLAELYELQGRHAEAELHLKEFSLRQQNQLQKTASFLSEMELAKYTLSFQIGIDCINSILFHRQQSGIPLGIFPEIAFQNELFYKGFLLHAASRLNHLANSNSKCAALNRELMTCRRKLAAEYVKPIAERSGLHDLEERANVLEKEITRLISGYDDAKKQLQWQDIQSKLNVDEAVIEFTHCKISFPKKEDSIVYAALLLRPGMQSPKYVFLCEENSLDSLLHSQGGLKADYVNNLYTLSNRGAVAIEAAKRSLYELVWKPLQSELNNVKTIYFSPTGLLHRINIDAIPVSETETLADRFQLIQLNSTRQLVISDRERTKNNEAVLLGGIEYERDTSVLHPQLLVAATSSNTASIGTSDISQRGGSWNYLAGTDREVNAIDKIMQASGIKAQVFKGFSATEELFKSLGASSSVSPQIIHIATHGFFYADQSKKNNNQQSTSGSGLETQFKISEHPMMRSGLILSGGNASWQGQAISTGKEDGILSAFEISQMNLWNTELIVLSACETGLGDIQSNEVVYGLQRAFKIAGAKYIIMSLWQVPDKQTSLLMTTFYKKWLEDKRSIPTAFHAAQKELRNLGMDPYQWAGFVLVE